MMETLKKSNLPSLLLLYVITFFLIANLTFSQNRDTAFQKINFTGKLCKPEIPDFIAESWNANYAIDFSISLPFYYGDIQAGILYMPFITKVIDAPDFKTFYVSTGWGAKLYLTKNIFLSASAKIGSVIFNFSVDTLKSYGKTENEFALGANFNLNYEIVKNISVNAGIDILKIFTNQRQKYLFLNGGITYTIITPNWFKEILE